MKLAAPSLLAKPLLKSGCNSFLDITRQIVHWPDVVIVELNRDARSTPVKQLPFQPAVYLSNKKQYYLTAVIYASSNHFTVQLRDGRLWYAFDDIARPTPTTISPDGSYSPSMAGNTVTYIAYSCL
jgi:hypothetical protein